MTPRQYQTLLRQSIRYIAAANGDKRRVFMNSVTMRIEPRSVAHEIARTDMLLAKMRLATARPKAARRAK